MRLSLTVLFFLALALVAAAEDPEPAEVALPLNQARILRPYGGADAPDRDSPAAATVVAAVEETGKEPDVYEAEVLKRFKDARGRSPQRVPAGTRPILVCSGPVLDGPDHVQAASLVRKGNLVSLVLVHTSARLAGTALRRNIPWVPVAVIPLDLPPGSYTLAVEWRALESLPDGKPFDAPPLKAQAAFVLAER